MAKRSNPKLIGAFVVGAIALAVVGAIAFGGTKFLETRRKAVLFFEGSVGGLAVGAPVNFRGVQIGSVTGIKISYDIDKQLLEIPVEIEILPDMIHVTSGERNEKRNMLALVQRGLRAQLVVQSLVTGQASVEFDFHPDAPLRLTGYDTGGLPELPTVPSSMDTMQANVAAVLQKLSQLPLDQIANQVATALGGLQQTLNDASTLLKNVDAGLEPTMANLQETSEQARQLMVNANERIAMRDGEPLQTLNDTLKDYGDLAQQLQGKANTLTGDLQKTLAVLNTALSQVNDVTALLERDIQKNPALLTQTTDTLREFKAMAASIRALAEYLQRNPNALLTGKQ
ncbi:MAG TPA: MlaD family protein [Hypericibacter adhaerens]|jgi:paraquat-inducible protein B|uniref:MlaD family protein n=1 Tax=Hypericibacter adhaerens TaxID=2602016 RepID=UPI002BE960F2|nr:MlaD family protein [Hypericibacter adhaerens]HWA43888.1 MlaD family protein [Hypericibacter adhaerens]